MHEFSIAESIIESIVNAALKEKLTKIEKVTLIVGSFTSVNNDSLMFAMDALKKEHSLENMKVEILDIPLEVKCRECGSTTLPEDVFLMCSDCGSTNVEIIHGKELYIKSIEAE